MQVKVRDLTRWKKKDIYEAFKKSRRIYHSPALDIKIAHRKNAPSKILIITPRATGTAPERNKFKRRVKAIFYEEKLSAQKFDWIIFAKKAGMNLCFQELKNIILQAAHSLGNVSQTQP
jgi:ribonuclease P protein component